MFRPLQFLFTENPEDKHAFALEYLDHAVIGYSPVEKEILDFYQEFHEKYDGIPTVSEAIRQFTKLSRTTAVEYLELYYDENYSMPLQVYKANVDDLSDNRRDSIFRETLDESLNIMETGMQAGRVKLKGRKDAYEYIEAQSISFMESPIDRVSTTLREAAKKAEASYERAVNNPQDAYGITCGIFPIDDKITGGKPGELHFVLGYTGSGKSLFSLNYGYNAAIFLNMNVVIFSLEMTSDQVTNRLIALHSAHEKFRGISEPILRTDFEKGTFSNEDKEFFFEHVVRDLKTNEEYGEIFVEYPGEKFTVAELRNRLNQIKRRMDIDMVIVDYPELMSAEKEKQYKDYVSTLNSILKDLKQVALTFNGGKGVFILCPYQANRQGHERAAKNNGIYDPQAMSYANEAERACDVIYALFKEPDSTNPSIIFSNLKHRGGEPVESFKLSVAWGCGFISVDDHNEEVSLDDYNWDSI